MAVHKLLLLPGDGIGPEVMAEVKKLVGFFNDKGLARFEIEEALVGGFCYDAHKVAITDETMAKAQAADAILFGAVGGPKWDGVPYDVRPEAGLLRLRKDLALYANLRPAVTYPALAEASSLKRELVEGLDIMIVRELTGGVYFGEPKTITELGNGQKRAIDTQVYDTYEIDRIATVALDLARERKRLVHSAEKRNVMKTGVLWNEVVTQVHKARYCDVTCRSAARHDRHPERSHHGETPTGAEGNVYRAPTGPQTGGGLRRPSRDGRGVRVYIVPEDSEAKILAKAKAAREGGATG